MFLKHVCSQSAISCVFSLPFINVLRILGQVGIGVGKQILKVACKLELRVLLILTHMAYDPLMAFFPQCFTEDYPGKWMMPL